MGIRQDIGDAVAASAMADGLRDDQAFGYWFLEEIMQLSREDALLTVTDGPWDGGRDAVYFDEDNGVLRLFQFKYSDNLVYALSGLSDLQRAVQTELERVSACREVWLYLATPAAGDPHAHGEIERVRSEIQSYLTAGDHAAELQVEFFDLERFIQLFERLTGVAIDLQYKTPPLAVDGAVLGLVDASAFRAFIDQEELLAFNIRQFLGLRKGSVNTEIYETLKVETDRLDFWRYNNGLVCLCTDYRDRGDGTICFTDLTIVNGAQTINTIARYLKDNPIVTTPVWVLAKIIKVRPTDIYEAVRLTKTSNTQNAANNKDLRAIDVSHTRLERWLHELTGAYYVYKRGQHAPRGADKVDMKELAQAYVAFWDQAPEVAFANTGRIFSDGDYYGAVFPADEIADLNASGNRDQIEAFVYRRLTPLRMLAVVRAHIDERVSAGDDTKWRSLAYHMLWLYRHMFERQGVLNDPQLHDIGVEWTRATVKDVYDRCKLIAGILGTEIPRELKTTSFTDTLRANTAIDELVDQIGRPIAI